MYINIIILLFWIMPGRAQIRITLSPKDLPDPSNYPTPHLIPSAQILRPKPKVLILTLNLNPIPLSPKQTLKLSKPNTPRGPLPNPLT